MLVIAAVESARGGNRAVASVCEDAAVEQEAPVFLFSGVRDLRAYALSDLRPGDWGSWKTCLPGRLASGTLAAGVAVLEEMCEALDCKLRGGGDEQGGRVRGAVHRLPS